MSNQITPNPSVPSQIVQEVKFPKFVNNLGIIPTSYKDSMSYYECLAWLCKYLEETVIPTLNQNGNAVQELQNLYIELNSYVTNYFDNLDVQQEINNKLDKMVSTGQLQILLSEQYAELKNEVNNEIDELTENVNDQINGISSVVTSLASGSPLVASSTSGMTDTSKIYVNTSDGKWYYYNGTAWTIGGTYQSTGIGINEIQAENLELSLRDSINISVPTITWNEGYYRNSIGVRASNSDYSNSDNISLNQGDKLYFLCNAGATTISVIAPVTPEGDPIIVNSNLANVLSIGDVINIYKYTASFDCEVSLSILNANSYSYCFIEKSDDKAIIQSLLNYRIPELDFIYHSYANGENVQTNNLYFVSDPIQLYEGETIKFHAKGEGSAVSLLRLVEDDGTYISTIYQTSGTKEYDVAYTAVSDCYVSICSQVIFLNNLLITREEITNIYDDNMFSSFIKMGVIGDSLASGEAVANNGGTLQYIDNYDYSWGQFIARNHGMNCINFSKGGATTRTFLRNDNDWGLTKLLNPDNKCNTYIIGLGVNDSGISNYLGSISDIHLEDFTQNADSFFGNYAKIIGYIQQVQPKAKIFALTIPGNYTDYNNAIRSIVDLYSENVYLIDLYSYYYDDFNSGFVLNNKREGHYNSIGYNYISEVLYKALTDYMNKNYNNFKQIEFIGTNYSYTTTP